MNTSWLDKLLLNNTSRVCIKKQKGSEYLVSHDRVENTQALSDLKKTQLQKIKKIRSTGTNCASLFSLNISSERSVD